MIVRVIDDTGSASLVLFDGMVHKLVNKTCVEVRNANNNLDADGFPKRVECHVGQENVVQIHVL